MGTGFNDPATSKELALAQFNQGAKYIFAFSAAGNTGIFEAAKDKTSSPRRVDTDQRSIDPGPHPRIDGEAHRPGRPPGGLRSGEGPVQGRRRTRLGLKDKAVGPAFLTLDNINPPSKLPQDVQDKVKAIAADIVSGKIVVTDFLAQ